MTSAIAGSAAVDADDVRIIRALQVAPRIGFAQAASVLGLSEASVARRFRRLVRDGVIRVVGVVNTAVLGQSRWVLRVRCRPGSAAAIADALARRDDVTWVALSAAGAELTCVVRSRTDDQRDILIGQRLPRTAAVTDIQASVMLHQFIGGRGHYWAALHGALTSEQERQLGLQGHPFTESPVINATALRLSDQDTALLDQLTVNGRANLVELAEATASTPGKVSRRLHALLDSGALYVDVEISAAALGYLARAHLWLRVHPAHVKEAGHLLAQMPQIAFAAAVSGRENLHAVVHCQNLHDLFEFTSDRIGAIPGVEAVDVAPIVRQVKQMSTRLTGDRLTLVPRVKPAP